MTKPSHADSVNTDSSTKNWWPLIHRLTSIVAFVVIGGIAWASLRSQQSDGSVAELEREAEVQTSTVEARDLETATSARVDPVDNPVAQSQESNSPVAKLTLETPAAASSPAAESNPEPDVPEPNVPEPDVPEPIAKSTTDEKNPTATAAEELGPPPKFYDADVAQLTFKKTCSQCHKITRPQNFDFKDLAGVEAILTRMSAKMEKKGLTFNEKQRAFVKYYLASTYLK